MGVFALHQKCHTLGRRAQTLKQIVQCFRAGFDAVFLYRLGTIRIVEIQDARLSESVCSAVAERMKGLPSIFVGRPSTVLTIRGIAPCRNGIAVA